MTDDGRGAPGLLDYLAVLRRRKWLFLLTLILAPAVALAVSHWQTPVYQASADVLLSTRNTAGGLGGTPQIYVDPARVAQTEAELARVPAVVDAALKSVPGHDLTVVGFLKASSVATRPGSDFLTFSTKHSNPRMAMRLATAYAQAFTEYQHRREMERLEALRDRIARAIERLETTGGRATPTYRDLVRQERELSTMLALETPTAQVVREADRAQKIRPRTAQNGLIAVALGLVLGLMVAFLADALDTRVRSEDVLRDALELRLLGRLPAPPPQLSKEDRLVMLAEPMSHDAEPFRLLRANFDFANAEYRWRTIMLTSAVDAEGKSTTAGNLAVALARAGRRVILVDADLRSPKLHSLFGLDEKPGLVDVQLGDADLDEALRPIDLAEASSASANARGRPGSTGSLEVLTAGHALLTPDELGAESAIGQIVQNLRDQADVVLIDAAPLLPVGDAIALSAYVDALVLVTRLRALRTSMLEDMSRILSASPAAKLGFVLTGAKRSEAYAQYHRYGADERRKEDKRPLALRIPSPDDGADDRVARPRGGKTRSADT